jgi:hypothetical protein
MAADLAYVGTRMDHLATAFNANQIPLGGTTKPFPNLGSVNEYAFIGTGNYNGLQARLNRRFSEGLQFTASYTYSHTIDDSNGAFSTTNGGGRIFLDQNGNPLLNFNRGNADGDIRHFFVFSSLYELPFGKGRRFGSDMSSVLDYLIGGWQWNNIISLSTGTPMDLNVNGLAGNQGNRPDVSGGVSASIIGGKGVISGTFTQPPSNANVYSRPGNLGRNAIYGPGLHTWDMGVFKDFKFGERWTTQLRAEVFNLFNTPQFQNGSFNTNMGSGGTGTSQTAATRFSSERQIQIALRVTF